MIAIVDYDAGNIGSVANALKRLGADFKVTSDPETIKASDGVIFPGQGRAGPAMESLRQSGLDKVLPRLKQPFFGICLGMQLMVEEIEEDNQKGLAIIAGKCIRLQSVSPVPHMGWNKIQIMKRSRLLSGIEDDAYQYFAHSYAAHVPHEYKLAITDYGVNFDSAIQKGNFYGVQFHPEKSADAGDQILKNFLRICGEDK